VGPLRPCRSSTAVIWSTTSARRWRPSSLTIEPRCRPRRQAQPRHSCRAGARCPSRGWIRAGARAPPKDSARPRVRARRNAPRVAAYQAVHTLHARGTPIAAIARALGLSRPPVYAYLRRHAPPSPKRPQWRPSARVLTPYVPYLIRRWRESGADSMQLWREIQARGYRHSARTVCRFIPSSGTSVSRRAHCPRPSVSSAWPPGPPGSRR
jgi:hypothetical protein